MSTSSETTPIAPVGDNERLVDAEHELVAMREQATESVRNQLDTRLLTPDLNDNQRITIVDEAMHRVDRLKEDPASINVGEIDGVISWLAGIVNTTTEYDGTINTAHQQALKYFSGTLLEMIRVADSRGDQSSAEDIAGIVYEAYLAASPNITTYAGGLAGQVELLSYAERSPTARTILQNVAGEIIYNGSFSDDESLFDEQIAEKTPIAQLELINTVTGLAKQAEYQGEWAEPFAEKVINGFSVIAAQHETRPFVRIAASIKRQEVYETLNEEWVDLESFPLKEQKRLTELDLERRAQYASFQAELHERFPDLGTGDLTVAANNAAIETVSGVIDTLVTIDGKRVQLADIVSRNDLALSEDEAVLLQALYDPTMRQAVEGELGIALSQLSLDEQRHLLTFMVEAEPERYSRLIKALDGAGDQRQQLAKAFLATKFGKDFGSAILGISENSTPEQSGRVFEIITALRERTKEFAAMFASIDPELAKATEEALNERITDALVAVQEVAIRGSLHEDVAPHRNTPEYESNGSFDISIASLDEVFEIFGGLEKTFSTTHDIVTAPDLRITKVNENDMQFTTYRFMSKTFGNCLAYIRPEGAYGYDKQNEYGNKRGVEASTSFIVNPIAPHDLLIPKDTDGVSIRFDREGRSIDESPDSKDRDPTREEGLISIDISSVMGPAESLPVRIGRLIAAGNRIRARREGTPDSLHHNTNYFNQAKFGSSEGFAKLSRDLIRQIEAVRQLTRRKHLGALASRYDESPVAA